VVSGKRAGPPGGRVNMTGSGLERFVRALSTENEVVIEATGDATAVRPVGSAPRTISARTCSRWRPGERSSSNRGRGEAPMRRAVGAASKAELIAKSSHLQWKLRKAPPSSTLGRWTWLPPLTPGSRRASRCRGIYARSARQRDG
jgi:hypothetical protein